MAQVKDAEVIVYATPIYYYEMAGQMKTLLDRLNLLFPSDYAGNHKGTMQKAYELGIWIRIILQGGLLEFGDSIVIHQRLIGKS